METTQFPSPLFLLSVQYADDAHAEVTLHTSAEAAVRWAREKHSAECADNLEAWGAHEDPADCYARIARHDGPQS